MRERSDDNPDQPSPIKLRVLAARRARSAIGVTAITLLTVISAAFYRHFLRDNPRGIQGIFLVGVVGLVLLNLSRTNGSKRMTELAILRFYKSFRFYGGVVSITSGLLFVYALTLEPRIEVRARVAPVAPAAQAEPAPLPAPLPAAMVAPEFPNLKLSGVIVGGTNSTAIINLKTVRLGERCEGVRLVEVRENSIVVELDGFTKTISRFAPITPASSRR